MKNINKKLSDTDRQDLSYILSTLKASTDAFNQIAAVSDLTESEYLQYLQGCCDVLIHGKIELHRFRQMVREKYDVPYEFASINGDLFLEED